MSYVRRHFSAADLAAPAARPLRWPAVSISLLFVFAIVAPAGLISGMNLYLLLLVGIAWLGTRRHSEPALLWLTLPFLAMIVIGLVGGIGAERYLYLKDAWYYSNPAVVMVVGFAFGRLLGDIRVALRAAIVGAALVALFQLIPFALHPELLLRDATRIRTLVGTGYHATALGAILLLGAWGRWRERLALPPWLGASCLLLCLVAVGLSFSRTMLLDLAIGVLAMAGFFARREGLRVAALVAAAVVVLVSAQAAIGSESASDKRSFTGKLARSLDELTLEDSRDRALINVNWRGFESARAIETWRSGNPLQLVFGQGFGKQVDLGLFQNLGDDPRAAVRFIPVLHNGFMYLLVKTGLAGVAIYLAVLLWIYRVGRSTAAGPADDARTFHGRALQGCAAVLLCTTWVVAGALNKFDMFAFLLITGALIAERTRRPPDLAPRYAPPHPA